MGTTVQPSNSPTEPPSLATLGALREAGYASRSVKAEVAANLARRIAAVQPLVEGVLGYEDDVLPQLENALLAGHDVILLGERGQAKTRLLRSLVALLDEWIPVIEGSELHDDPLAPVSAYARELVAERGDETPIAWLHRDRRYGEKLATPDTSVADLIGEVDPIKVAEGRYLADERTLHYGLVPRTNRGIFAVNELPDLAERIQVSLLNVLEERDVQVRGYSVRLPLDLLFVASANPEDYTNRGRIITPLKDRFGAQIRTHYPRTQDVERAVIAQEARPTSHAGVEVFVPGYMTEVVAGISQAARRAPKVNQHSGVSVRVSVANYETLVVNAVRRALVLGEPEAVPRVSDLAALAPSTLGKLEVEVLEDGREQELFEQLVAHALLAVFRARVPLDAARPVLAAFEAGAVVEIGDRIPAADYLAMVAGVDGLGALAGRVAERETPGALASAVELVLEGLHLAKRLNKDQVGAGATYRGRG